MHIYIYAYLFYPWLYMHIWMLKSSLCVNVWERVPPWELQEMQRKVLNTPPHPSSLSNNAASKYTRQPFKLAQPFIRIAVSLIAPAQHAQWGTGIVWRPSCSNNFNKQSVVMTMLYPGKNNTVISYNDWESESWVQTSPKCFWTGKCLPASYSNMG